ncbi:MAG: hypothetical protein ABI416_10565, partial [Ginsengibacter sp.]
KMISGTASLHLCFTYIIRISQCMCSLFASNANDLLLMVAFKGYKPAITTSKMIDAEKLVSHRRQLIQGVSIFIICYLCSF